ncbi:hypothetical protein GCM10028895_38120 [Pontibacter rugosus]
MTPSTFTTALAEIKTGGCGRTEAISDAEAYDMYLSFKKLEYTLFEKYTYT